MSLSFFNTMNRQKEEFKALSSKVGLYTCGPTVYNYAHIGNFRAYIFEDLLRRVLKYYDYEVQQVMNLTDVDDKTIRGSQNAGMSLNDFTAKYKKSFFEDLKILRIEPAEHYPAATEHIPEMIDIIKTLMDKGFAYQADDKSIYFSISKFPEYGKLAKIDMENQRSGVRINTDEYEKDSVADFALWKSWNEADGDVVWDSPWGKGRPGWHIECSAMSMKYLGKTFDIHTGGIDNMFPHHEDEIAQSEAANDCKFVNYWLHCAHLIVNGDKMSKSANNFFTLRDLLDKGFSGKELRFVLLSTHYRKKLNFTFDGCEQSRKTLNRFKDFFQRLREITATCANDNKIDEIISEAMNKFKNSIGDDLNISEALSATFTLQNSINKLMDNNKINLTDAETVLETFRKFDKIFDFFDVDKGGQDVPSDIIALVADRQNARKNKDYSLSDKIRDDLKSKGWIIEDLPEGPRVKQI